MKLSVFFILSITFFFTQFSGNIYPQTTKDTVADNSEQQTYNLYLISGYALSYEFHKVNNSLFRFQFDFSSNSNSNDLDGERNYSSSSLNSRQPYSEENSGSSLSLALSFHYIYKFLTTNYGEVYGGFGPILGYSGNRSEYKSHYINSDTVINRSSDKSIVKNYTVGIILILGVKAYLTNNIGIFAETHISGGRNWVERKYNSFNINDYPNAEDYISTTSTDESGSGWFHDARFIRMGISISI